MALRTMKVFSPTPRSRPREQRPDAQRVGSDPAWSFLSHLVHFPLDFAPCSRGPRESCRCRRRRACRSRKRSTRWRTCWPSWRPSANGGRRRGGPPHPPGAGQPQTQDLQQPHAVADGAGVAAHATGRRRCDYIELIFDEFVELHGDRAIGDDRAIRTGFARLGDFRVLLVGHQKGHTLKEQAECLLRLRPSRGLPQGAEQDAAGGQVPPADRLPDRHAGRLPRHRRRGARPGPAHRHQPPGDVAAADADRLRGHRGGGIRRGPGHRHRRPGEHAGARLLLGHQPGGVCRHPVEDGDRGDQAAGRRGAAADRPRPVCSWA